jgi:hypothetical protein
MVWNGSVTVANACEKGTEYLCSIKQRIPWQTEQMLAPQDTLQPMKFTCYPNSWSTAASQLRAQLSRKICDPEKYVNLIHLIRSCVRACMGRSFHYESVMFHKQGVLRNTLYIESLSTTNICKIRILFLMLSLVWQYIQ